MCALPWITRHLSCVGDVYHGAEDNSNGSRPASYDIFYVWLVPGDLVVPAPPSYNQVEALSKKWDDFAPTIWTKYRSKTLETLPIND
ncbi:hypothetical protein AcV5_007283 [Taiwanofungus camphoratus]|nr:hypothetical protein AcV5_007283 [Antrodia cinnamomea]